MGTGISRKRRWVTAAGVPRRAPNPNPILRVTQFIKGFQEYQDFIEDDMIVCVQEEASVIRVRRTPAPLSYPSTPLLHRASYLSPCPVSVCGASLGASETLL